MENVRKPAPSSFVDHRRVDRVPPGLQTGLLAPGNISQQVKEQPPEKLSLQIQIDDDIQKQPLEKLDISELELVIQLDHGLVHHRRMLIVDIVLDVLLQNQLTFLGQKALPFSLHNPESQEVSQRIQVFERAGVPFHSSHQACVGFESFVFLVVVRDVFQQQLKSLFAFL